MCVCVRARPCAHVYVPVRGRVHMQCLYMCVHIHACACARVCHACVCMCACVLGPLCCLGWFPSHLD